MIIDSDSDDGNNDTQSDLIRICLNLSFLPEEQGRAFQYNKSKMAEEVELRMVNAKRQETVLDHAKDRDTGRNSAKDIETDRN